MSVYPHGRDMFLSGHPTASTRASDARVFLCPSPTVDDMDVFISYSRKDRVSTEEGKDVISKIQQAFRDNGITYWLDEEGIHSGETFASVISRNIAESKVFLFVSSVNSNASRWTCGEIATASTYEKRIIPFKIDDAPYDASITIYLAALDTINYAYNPERALRRLVKSVKLYLAELEAEKRRQEEERRIAAEKEKIRQERERLRAESEQAIALINIEQAEVEEKIRTLDARIDDLLAEKGRLLKELTGVKSQIAGLRNVDGDIPSTRAEQPPITGKKLKWLK